MNHPILDFVPYFHEEDGNLLRAPVKSARQSGHGESLEASRRVLVMQSSNLLVLLILGPVVERPFVRCDRNVDEASICHVVYKVFRVDVRAPKLFGCLCEQRAPSPCCRVGLEGAVIGRGEDVEFL